MSQTSYRCSTPQLFFDEIEILRTGKHSGFPRRIKNFNTIFQKIDDGSLILPPEDYRPANVLFG
jgi:hypothetical protein